MEQKRWTRRKNVSEHKHALVPETGAHEETWKRLKTVDIASVPDKQFSVRYYELKVHRHTTHLVTV